MDAHTIIPRLIAAVLSLLDAANLRNRAYHAEQRVETLLLAIEDIERINLSNTANSQELIAGIISRVHDKYNIE